MQNILRISYTGAGNDIQHVRGVGGTLKINSDANFQKKSIGSFFNTFQQS